MDANPISHLDRGAMLRAIRRTIERFVAISIFGFIAVGCMATLVSLVTARRQYDAELIDSTDEVGELVKRIYDYRKVNDGYPRSLEELRPIAGDVVSKHERDHMGNDENFCSTWCWRYFYRGDTSPPTLFRSISHGNLTYEFAPSWKNSYPTNVDEGWIASNEGSERYLRSFFVSHPVGSAREVRPVTSRIGDRLFVRSVANGSDPFRWTSERATRWHSNTRSCSFHGAAQQVNHARASPTLPRESPPHIPTRSVSEAIHQPHPSQSPIATGSHHSHQPRSVSDDPGLPLRERLVASLR